MGWGWLLRDGLSLNVCVAGILVLKIALVVHDEHAFGQEKAREMIVPLANIRIAGRTKHPRPARNPAVSASAAHPEVAGSCIFSAAALMTLE